MDGATKNDEHEPFAAALGVLSPPGGGFGDSLAARWWEGQIHPWAVMYCSWHIKSNPFLAPRMDFWALGTSLHSGCASLLVLSY